MRSNEVSSPPDIVPQVPTETIATDAEPSGPIHRPVIHEPISIEHSPSRRRANGAPAQRKIVLTGSCSVLGLTATLRFLFPHDSIEGYSFHVPQSTDQIVRELADADVWVMHALPENDELSERSLTRAKRISCPQLVFSGFHPDMVYAWRDGIVFRGATGDYHSAIGLWAWRRGLDVPEATRLFSPTTFRRLGYYDAYHAEIAPLRDAFVASGFDFSWFWLRLKRSGVFMHTLNHPRIDAIVLLAKLIAVELGMTPDVLEQPIERYVHDELSEVAVWPVYPGLSTHLGVPGSYVFSFGRIASQSPGFAVYRSVPEFLEAQWAAYGDVDPSGVSCSRIMDGVFDSVLEPLLVGAP